MRKVQTRFTIDPDIMEWLKREAKKRRVSMSHIIRELLLKEMEKQDGN